MTIVFKIYDKNNKLDQFNKKLIKISKDRFELRKSKNNIWYIYDYDYREITRRKTEIKDILECMNLYNDFKEVIK